MATRRAFPLFCLLLTVWLAVPAAQAQTSGCTTRFPEVEWVLASETPALSVYSAGIAPAVLDRFEADARQVADWLTADLGATRRTDLCLFGPDVEIDATAIVPFGQRLHSAAFGPESVLVINTSDVGRVKPAIAYGLAYVSLWEAGDGVGLAGYPQPLADAVAQWYMARATGSLDADHAVMLRANFLRDPTGREPPTDWAAGLQDPTFTWNPEFGASPIGDMVEYAVATRGAGILLDPTSETWFAIETEYEAALHDELFGDVGGSFGWPWGLALVLLVLTLALVLSGYEWRRKRRAKARRPISEAPIEGLFER